MVSVEGAGDEQTVTVDFDTGGRKEQLLSWAPLRPSGRPTVPVVAKSSLTGPHW